jgi:hypothetical protein
MARIVSQAIDEQGNFYLLKDDGILEKRDPLNALVWSQQTRQEPTTGTYVYANHAVLDLDNNVWLTFSDTLNIEVRSGSIGLHMNEVLGTAANVIVPQTGGLTMYALSTSRGILYEIPKATKVLNRSFDLSVVIPGYIDGMFTSQIASSLSGTIWFGAFIDPTRRYLPALVKFEPAGTGTFTPLMLEAAEDVPVVAVGADNAGCIFAATLHGGIFRYNESISVNAFDAFYEPLAPGGVIDVVTFTNANDLVLVDDGTFAFAGTKTRIVSRANGTTISTTAGTSIGTFQGDPLGYHHVKLTRINVLPVPIVPVVDPNKLDVYVKTDGSVTFTGRPGFVFDATEVQCFLDAVPLVPVGTVVPNADGSFSVTAGAGAANPLGEPCTVKSVNGIQVVNTAVNSQPRNLPVGFTTQFLTAPYAFAGMMTRFKVKVYDALGVVVPPSPTVFPVFRLKRDLDGKWFNGTSFVADNGDYIQPSFDSDGQNWFAAVTFPPDTDGAMTFIVKDSPPYTDHFVVVPPPADGRLVQEIHTMVTELINRADPVMSAPAGSFPDPRTIGGFIFERLNDIQKDVHVVRAGVQGQRGICLESIIVDVSTQTTPKGSTPAIDIVVYDADRRFPIDISGAAVFFKAKINLASPVLIIDRTGEVVDGRTGQARVKLTASDTEVARRLSAQVVLEIPGTGTLVSPSFWFDVSESVL